MTVDPKDFDNLSDAGEAGKARPPSEAGRPDAAFSLVLDSRIVPPRQRFEFWRTTCLELGAPPLVVEAERRHDFVGRCRISGTPSLVLADLRTSLAHDILRNRTAFARGGSDKIMLVLVLRGTIVFEQRGRVVSGGPGEVLVIDLDVVFKSRQRGAEASRTVCIPAEEFPAVVSDRLPAVLTPGTSSITALVAGYIRAIPNDATTLVEARDLIKSQLVALIGQALAPGWCRVPETGRLYDAMCRMIDAQVGDPDLSAKTLCAQLGVSRSTLFDALASEGDTLSGLILDRRLEGCLADMQRDGSGTLAMICERWGFRDQSTFTRTFKRRFGVPPSRWRERRSA